MPMTMVVTLHDMMAAHKGGAIQIPNGPGQHGGITLVWADGASCRHTIGPNGVVGDIVEPPSDPKELATARLRYYRPRLEKASLHYNQIVDAVRLQSHVHGQAGRACPSASEAYPNWKKDLQEVNVLIAELQQTVSGLEEIAGKPIVFAQQTLHADRANEDHALALEELRELDQLCNATNP